MLTEYIKLLSGGISKTDKKELTDSEEDFGNLVLKSIPGWTAVWKMLLQEKNSDTKKDSKKIKPMDLEKRIQKKITELVNEEEALLRLYGKASEVAEKRADEFKGKTAVLRAQIEKDKTLMKTLGFNL